MERSFCDKYVVMENEEMRQARQDKQLVGRPGGIVKVVLSLVIW